MNALKDIDLQLKSEIIEHFTQDEHLATGMSFIVKESPFSDLDQHTSAFKGAVKFSKTRTGGFYNIIVDDFGAKKRKSMQQTSDEREQEIPKDREQNKKREINKDRRIVRDCLKNRIL